MEVYDVFKGRAATPSCLRQFKQQVHILVRWYLLFHLNKVNVTAPIVPTNAIKERKIFVSR